MADIQEMFKDAWSSALAGVNAAEAEAEKVLGRLGFSPDDVKRHAREFGERLTTQRKDLERAIDDAVKRTANRFRIPTQADIVALQKRVDDVSARVDALAQEKRAG
jgi:polyhydroxyalkanoate synthesis regulator phasin